VEEGHLSIETAKELASVPNVAQQALAPRGLSKTELRRLLKEVDLRGTLRDRALIYLMLHTGLRLGEAAALGMDDVALSTRKGTLKLRSEWAKGGKERIVPIPALARNALTAYIVARPEGPSGHVFQGERGPIGRAGIAKVIAKYATSANVAATPHSLRHCFAYRYLEQSSNDLVGLAALLGHSNLNTTLGYTRKRLEDLAALMEPLDFA
jgi:integrase/recombinase XerC